MTRLFGSGLCRRVAALILPVLVAAPALADMPVTYRDEGRSLFSLSVPDFWSVRAGGARMLAGPDGGEERAVARVIGLEPTADKGVWVGFISPRGVRDFDDALEYLRQVGPFLVKDAAAETHSRRVVGGLPAATIAGTGRRDGKAVSFTAVLIDLPGNRMAISVTVLEAGADPALVGDVNAIYGSFRAAR